MKPGDPDPDERVQDLLKAIRAELPRLETLLREVDDHWVHEDGVYRFYHQSWKVYGLQEATDRIVVALKRVAPHRALNEWFVTIVEEGTGRRFTPEHNQRWLEETRPIVEAFFHSRYFLEMTCRYGRELTEAPASMPTGWAAVLYLYGMR